MYLIRGADEKEYGPAPTSVVERWIAERRLDARSRIRREGEPIWRPLSEFPEFADALAGGGKKAPPTGVPPPAGPTLAGYQRTSGLAIATLVIGILAPCTAGLAGLIGIIVGLFALRKISRSQGRLKGRGLAITGLILSVLFLVAIPPLVITAIVAQQRAQRGGFANFDPGQECLDHARQLSEAIRRHANDNNDRFPAADGWCDAIQAGVNGLNTFQCPGRSDLRCGFALNAAVAGKTKFAVPPETVLLFEANTGWNGSGGQSVASAPRHGGLLTIVLADGTIRQVAPGDLSSLKWTP